MSSFYSSAQNSFVPTMSQSQITQGLRLIARELGENYYPLTELLCKNARIQAEWLNGQNGTTFTRMYSELYNELSIMVDRHIEISRLNLAMAETGLGFKDGVADMKASQEVISEMLDVLRIEGSIMNGGHWKEMHQNLKMKLRVISNILNEMFKIENGDLISFFEKQS
jgi:hypothetical protein